MSGIGSPEGFLRMLHDELGLDLTEPELAADLDELPVWDSVYLLRLVTALEEKTGQRVPVRRVLEARSLQEIRELVGGVR